MVTEAKAMAKKGLFVSEEPQKQKLLLKTFLFL
jgi:hypothetical protein